MNTIALVPARCGSKSILLKNLKAFFGKPLVYWILHALQNAEELDQIYLATDCDEIGDTVNDFKFSKVVVYKRDKENAQDHSSTEDILLEFINKMNFNDDDTMILAQATSPLIQSDDIKKALLQYHKTKANSLLAASRLKRFFWTDDGQPINYDYQKRPLRQDFKGIFWETGAFYINTIGSIKKYKNRLCGNITIYELSANKAVDIDEPEDWAIAEYMMKKQFRCERKNKKIKLFATDVDGVLTDAGMYYSNNGDELKKFNTRDGKGFELLRTSGIKTAIFTSENTNIVKMRGAKLKVDYVYQGVNDKLSFLRKLCESINISLENVAYIGDDLNDLEILKNVGLSATPADGILPNKQVADYICALSGGNGCVREFIEYIVN